MNKYILNNFEFNVTIEEVLKRFHIESDSDDAEILNTMLTDVLKVARPKALYGVVSIDEKGDDYVVIENKKIVNPLIRKNVDKINRIFPYIATCGEEVQEWSESIDDVYESYWADGIKEIILGKAVTYLFSTVKEHFNITGNLSHMSPGSLKEWPISEQVVLFDLIGDVYSSVGVKLTDSFLMLPIKSVSGFYFTSEDNFENCSLCPLLKCPGRRAPYQLAEE